MTIFIRVKIDSIRIDELVITITKNSIEYLSYKDGYYRYSETIENSPSAIRTLYFFLQYQELKNIKCFVDGKKTDYRKVINP